jgi:maleamate amidohydrolase
LSASAAQLLAFLCDNLIVTGVSATVVDGLSQSYRTVVPEECGADKHKNPYFTNPYDMAMT